MNITKLVSYDYIGKDIYNLGFGDVNPDSGEVDDQSVADNGDMSKALAILGLK